MFEEFTEEYFLKQAKALGDELGVDTRMGSVYMDMAAGHCLRAAFFFANLKEMFNMFALDTCYADVLDDKAAEWGMTRHPATAAIFNAVFVGATPEVGDRFFAEDTEYYFTVIESDGGELLLEVETEGIEGNTLSAGTEIIPVDDIDNLNEAHLGEIHTFGADEETDDALRERIREKIAGPAENGNAQHYKTWCESVDGVGRARIDPLFAGENTVRAILYAPDGYPVDADIVEEVQNYIDPITKKYTFEDEDGNKYVCGDGLGAGVANLGAHFLAVAASAFYVTVSVNVSLTNGSTLEDCRMAALEVIKEYFSALALETDDGSDIIVRLSTIGAMISALPQVLDYSDLALNDAATNLIVNKEGTPVLEEVNILATD